MTDKESSIEIESSEPIIEVGQGGFSLEQFESAVGKKEHQEEDESAIEAAISKSEDDSEPESKEESEDKEETQKADNLKKEDAKKEEKTKESTPAEKKASIAAKLSDGKELVIPKDAIVPIKVDGEVVEVAVQDLVNNYSGEKSFHNRFSKVESIKTQLEKSQREFNEKVEADVAFEKEILTACNENKPQDAIMLLAERSGKSPAEMMKTFMKNLAASFQQFKDMTPGEIEASFIKMENDWLHKKADKFNKQAQEKKTLQEKAEQTAKQLEKLGLEQQDFADAYYELLEAGKLKDIEKGEPTKEVVITHARNKKLANLIGDAIDQVDSQLRGDRDLIVRLAKYVDLAEHSVEDVVYILKGVVESNGATASNPSKEQGKTKVPEKNIGAEPKKEKVFKSQAEMMLAFGY